MNRQYEINLFTKLVYQREKLIWLAQGKIEKTDHFLYRINLAFESYDYTAQVILDEIKNTLADGPEREKLAIYALYHGVNRQVRRYMCEPEFYQTFNQAIKHASDINRELINLKVLRRVSIGAGSL